jgi:hypothetical protein
MAATILLVALACGQPQPEKAVTDAEKKEFFEVLAKLPHRGEFFTEEAVTKAVPYTRVLLALTEKDVGQRDLYPLSALSSGLARRKESRRYAVANFGRIAHPQLKLGWAVMLFNGNATSPEVLTYLHAALHSEKEARTLAEMTGPGFEDFRERVTRAYESGRRSKVELVKRHTINALPEFSSGHSYTNRSWVFAPGPLLYAVRPHNQQGELTRYDLVKGATSRQAVPQPKGFKPELDFRTYFEGPALSVNGRGDLFCRWAIRGNGDHGLALLTKRSNSFLVKRVSLYLAHCIVVADPDGAWYLIEGGPNFTVHRVDEGLNLTRLGNFTGRGHHGVDIADARFISNEVLHLFWGDVLPRGNHLRMRCVDFDVKRRKWLHDREVFRLDKFVSSAARPTVLQLEDESLHYLWKVDEGAKPSEATGLYYRAEAEARTVKVAAAREYRATAAGDRIVLCYTLDGSPEKVFFRVINQGAPGPVSEVPANKGRKDSLSSEYMQLYAGSDRIWFVNTLRKDRLYELMLAGAK